MTGLQRTARLGLKSLWLHKLRSGLTALGIVFGVSSVVAMLAIGEGASQEAQDQIKKLGSRNIIITSVKPPAEKAAQTTGSRLTEYGITYDDLELIKTTALSVDIVVPMREIRQDAYRLQHKVDALVVGTVPWYQEIRSMPLLDGRFLDGEDMRTQKSICVINTEIAATLFPFDNPLFQTLKIAGYYYKIVGVIDDSALVSQNGTKATRRLYVPITTARSRFGEMVMTHTSSGREMEKVQLHQATVKVRSEEEVLDTAEVIRTLLSRRHKKTDFDLTVPLELLRQAERTKRIFNIVLGSIAAISLLVGGIGIMNIMLASVTERTREIGIRRALGAKRRDIIAQFLTETVLLSGCGGLLGIALGIALPLVVSRVAKMRTVVTPWSLVLAFGISAAVGIVFGIYPARRAAGLDPIEALRHE